MIRVGSLFSGVGGLDRGLELAGGYTLCWQAERDPYARRILRRHWPAVPCYVDVRAIYPQTAPPVDLLAGGFPCTDVSRAGQQRGIDGPQSGLWREFARLIGGLRPRFVLVENVPGLRDRGLDRVLGDLAGCGYDAEWTSFRAAAVGAAHGRERIYLVAYPAGTGLENRHRRAVFDAQRPARPERCDRGGDGLWPAESAFCGGADGLPGGLDGARRAIAARYRAGTGQSPAQPGVADRRPRLIALGNAVVPPAAAWVGAQLRAFAGDEV